MRLNTEQAKSCLQHLVKHCIMKEICNDTKLCTQHEDIRHSIRYELPSRPSDVPTLVLTPPTFATACLYQFGYDLSNAGKLFDATATGM